MDYLNIGCTPYEEPCLQTGKASSHHQKVECRVYREQIARYYPVPENGRLRVMGFAHEYGTYYEVCAYFDDFDDESVAWAYSVESDAKDRLANWDKDSIEMLKFYISDGQLPPTYFDEAM